MNVDEVKLSETLPNGFYFSYPYDSVFVNNILEKKK